MTQEAIQLITLAIVIGSGIGMPLILRGLAKQDADRTQLRYDIMARLDHLDACVDRVRMNGDKQNARLLRLEYRVFGEEQRND